MNGKRGQDSAVRRIGLVATSIGAAQTVLLTLVPVIAAHCGLSVARIGGLVALGTLCLMVAAPLWGAVSDARGRKPVVLAGLAGAALAQVLFVGVLLSMAAQALSLAAGTAALAATRVLYGLSAGGIYPACQAWAAESVGAGRRLAMLSRLSAAANLGRALGPMLALPALAIGPLWPLLWLAALPLVAMGVAVAVPVAGRASVDRPPRMGLDRRPLATLLLVALLGTATVGQLQVLLGPVFSDYYGLGAAAASSATAVLLLGVAALGFLLQWRVVGRTGGPRTSLAAGAALLAAGVGMLWFGLGTLWALPGLVLAVAGVAFLVPGYTTLISQGDDAGRQGRRFGWLALMHTGGYAAGFAAGGWFYTHVPAAPLGGLLAAVALLGVAVVLALTTERSARCRPGSGRIGGRDGAAPYQRAQAAGGQHEHE